MFHHSDKTQQTLLFKIFRFIIYKYTNYTLYLQYDFTFELQKSIPFGYWKNVFKCINKQTQTNKQTDKHKQQPPDSAIQHSQVSSIKYILNKKKTMSSFQSSHREGDTKIIISKVFPEEER